MNTAGFSETTRYEAPAHHEQKAFRAPEDWSAKVIEQIFADRIANQHNCWKPAQYERQYTNPQVNDILNNGLELYDSKTTKHHEESVKGKSHGDSDKEQWGLDHPLRGMLQPLMHKIHESNYSNPIEVFPELDKIPGAELLLKGIIRNELFHYDRNDAGEDAVAQAQIKLHKNHMPDVTNNGKIKHGDDLTIGYSQLSVNAVIKLEKEFPNQLGWMKGHELEMLENPQMAPTLVAATLMHEMKMYQNHGIKPTLEYLAYGYNPDLPGKSGKGHELLPTEAELKASSHLHNVLHHMQKAKNEQD